MFDMKRISFLRTITMLLRKMFTLGISFGTIVPGYVIVEIINEASSSLIMIQSSLN